MLFQKQLLFRSTFLKAGLTLFSAFGFLLFEIGGIKSSSIVVSREIKIEGIFYTCLTKHVGYLRTGYPKQTSKGSLKSHLKNKIKTRR